MMRYDPNKRPTAAECLQFEYFKVAIPIPINAPTNDREDDDKEEFKQTFTKRQTTDNFGHNFKSEIDNKPVSDGPTMSSLAMMKRARYKPNVNTKGFMQKK